MKKTGGNTFLFWIAITFALTIYGVYLEFAEENYAGLLFLIPFVVTLLGFFIAAKVSPAPKAPAFDMSGYSTDKINSLIRTVEANAESTDNGALKKRILTELTEYAKSNAAQIKKYEDDAATELFMKSTVTGGALSSSARQACETRAKTARQNADATRRSMAWEVEMLDKYGTK